MITDSTLLHFNFSVIFVVTDIAMDWSDHALWWPARNHWLTRTRSTLDQYGVAADALLHFTPMHKTLRVQLPDMRCLDCRVDFSVKTFNAVINLCKELGESRTYWHRLKKCDRNERGATQSSQRAFVNDDYEKRNEKRNVQMSIAIIL